MADPRAQVHAMMRGLVTRYFPKQCSAAKEMADFWHPLGDCGDEYDTADLSRKMNGTRKWTADDVIALQSITGSTRVTDAMATARGAALSADPLCNLQHCKALLTESGEGISALMALEDGGCKDAARAELMDIIEAAQAAIRDLNRAS